MSHDLGVPRPTLAERVGSPVPPASPADPALVRPVWVLTGTGLGWAPGLLREWTRAEDGSWLGVVVMVQGGEVGEWLVPGVMLRPGDEPPAWPA